MSGSARISVTGPGFPTASWSQWRARVDEELAGESFERLLVSHPPEGFEIQPLYAPQAPGVSPRPAAGDLAALSGPASGAEGEGRRVRLCRRYRMAGPAETADAIARDLEGGADALWLEIPGKTDSRPGIRCLRDFRQALGRAALEGVTLVVDGGGEPLPAAALALAARGSAGEGPELVMASDPLGWLAERGELARGLDRIERELAALARACTGGGKRIRAVMSSAVAYHEAGAHAGEELGWAMASAVHYLRRLEALGTEPADVFAQLSFRVAVGTDLFMEIAKLRALRLLWRRVAEACGVGQPPSAWIHAVSSRRSLSRRTPWVNALRVTGQVFAAMVGGADAVTPAPFTPRADESALRLARNTPLILAEEGQLLRVADPAGGSWYVETLTRQLAESGWRELRRVEEQGGMVRALAGGWIRQRVEAGWSERRERLARRSLAMTGVSHYVDPDEGGGDDEAVPVPRKGRRSAAGSAAVGRPEAPPRPVRIERERLMESAIAALREGATLGELAAGLGADSQPTRVPALAPRRDASVFESLRDRAERLARQERAATVFLLKLGEVGEHRERADFARDLFRAGGFSLLEAEAAAAERDGEIASLAATFRASGVPVACLCGSDVDYRLLGRELGRSLREAGARVVLAVGRPAGAGEALEASRWIHQGVDVAALLEELLSLWEEG